MKLLLKMASSLLWFFCMISYAVNTPTTTVIDMQLIKQINSIDFAGKNSY